MSRKNETAVAGVSLPPVKAGKPYAVLFNHPVEHRRVFRSLGTRDGQEAQRLAVILAGILQTPANWHNLPAGTPEAIRKVWGNPAPLPPQPTGAEQEQEHTGEFDAVWHSEQLEAGYQVKLQQMQLKYDELLQHFLAVQAENKSLKALLTKLGHNQTSVVTLPIIDAVKDFLANGQAGGARRTKNLKRDLKAFAEFTGKHVPCANIEPEKVISYVNSRKGRAKGSKLSAIRTEQLSNTICQFLEWSTKGIFRRQPVNDWRKKVCKNLAGKKDRYWIDQTEVDRLIAALPERWKLIANLQWLGGFRPEELSMLQTKNLFINGGVNMRVEPYGKWTPKTKRSIGTVNLPNSMKDTLLPLKDTKTALLFTDENGNEYEPEEFCKKYLVVLRAAATVAKLDSTRMDSRTLRRSCGKRILLQKIAQGRNAIEETAAVLRDHPDTVREHYADLLPSDVTQD